MPSFIAYLDQPSDSLKKTVHVLDERVKPEFERNTVQLGGFDYPGLDGKPIFHKVKRLLEDFHIYDIFNADIQVKQYEQAALYEVPDMLHLEVGTKAIIPVVIIPLNAQSTPIFEFEDDGIVSVESCGLVTPLKVGATTITVRASDNPILRYEIPVLVHEPS